MPLCSSKTTPITRIRLSNPHKGKAGSCVPAYLGGYVASLRVALQWGQVISKGIKVIFSTLWANDHKGVVLSTV